MIIKSFYGQQVAETGNTWRVFIKKPIYGHTVAINEKLLLAAKKHHKILSIGCPGALEEISPDDWIKKAKRIEKVFLYPSRPMVLYQANIFTPQPPEQLNIYEI